VESYYNDNRLSASKLKAYLAHDPAIAHWMETHSGPPSEALIMGTALHSVMEGKELVVSPFESYRTKEAKEWKANNPDAIRADDAKLVEAWKTSILNHLGGHQPALWYVWKNGEYEKEFFNDTHKCKVDVIHEGILLDWKTTRHTKADDVIREYQRYGAALQAAHYVDMADAHEFHFIVVSKTEPFPVWVVTCSDAFLDYGRKLRSQCEEIRERFLAKEHQDVLTLDPPPWVGKQDTFEDVEI